MEGEILKYPSSSHFLPVTDEEREMRLMYDNKRPYAVGHGVSVDWTINKNNSCEKVSITFIPKSHVMKPQFDDVSYSISGKEVPKLYSNNIFKLSYLSSNKLLKEELIKNLKGITNYYHGWIEELEKQNVENIYHDEKRRIIDRCSKSKLRIEEGISLLNDDQIFEIFKLSNEVMLYSMLQSEKLKNGPFELDNEIDEVKLDKETKVWRPFQLAFFLQVLPSLINENHNDRDLVDLIWFPTGGGKTEAYLFLAAFELIRRRYVYGEKGNGVGIINRYTYRFLSMDQFQRTSIMICALETIRKKIYQVNEKIGKEEFSIGLFVGEAISPNNLEPNPLFSERDKSSLTQLESLYKERDPRERNPFPISSCPSCGTFLLPKKTMKMMDGSVDVGAYGFKQNKRQFKTHCLNKKCEFHDKLPIYFIDEDITKNRPSFLLGTIDKFAVIPWDTASQQIFSAKNNSKYFPPSLIIQDELHLISGL